MNPMLFSWSCDPGESLSVVEGEDVTLRCRNKTTSHNPADFYKDGRLIGRSFTENMTIHGVTKRDEGLYKCTISGGGESAESRMAAGSYYCMVTDYNTIVTAFFYTRQ
uniref:Ig-like domain-containing protein n=1 Tax=Labrus bergylta TaxID=56723 RepID=A0A3Q3KU04_9LABR